ncbi:hypothetical protein HDV06_000286 [Boothiomyces sp. JEL0866]|nr:hypothetical protein HDV06_000286 [Boothiomyces sp. JEL0866]
MVIDDLNTLDVYFANTTKHQYITIASDYANNTDYACGKNLCLYDVTNPLGIIAINVTSAGQCMPPYCFKGPNHFYASKIPFDINHFLNSRHYVMPFANITLGECNMGEAFLKCLTGDCGGFISIIQLILVTPNTPPPNTTNPIAQIPIRGPGPNDGPASTVVVHFPGTPTGSASAPGNNGNTGNQNSGSTSNQNSGQASNGSPNQNINQNTNQNNPNSSPSNSGNFRSGNVGSPLPGNQSSIPTGTVSAAGSDSTPGNSTPGNGTPQQHTTTTTFLVVKLSPKSKANGESQPYDQPPVVEKPPAPKNVQLDKPVNHMHDEEAPIIEKINGGKDDKDKGKTPSKEKSKPEDKPVEYKEDSKDEKPVAMPDKVLPIPEKVADVKADKESDKSLDFKLDISDRDETLLSYAPKGSDQIDFKKVGQQFRTYRKYHEQLWDKYEKSSKSEKKSLIDAASSLDKTLFSWIKGFKSTIDMRDSFEGTGLVICAGNHQTNLAISTLRMIRDVHGSKIPFEVFYNGDGDLSKANREKFEKVPNTKTVDIQSILDNNHIKIGGWAIKSFALLASSFNKAMLIDADVVFLQSPDVLFNGKLFEKHGALFFHDRSLYSHGDETLNWFKSLMPDPMSEYASKLRVFKGTTAHEQESGVVLINKRENMLGLLATCVLNVDNYREIAYKRVFGDKETFWVGFESIEEKYIFNPRYPGAAGEVAEIEGEFKYEICARQLLHVDENSLPVWINGGIAISKYDKDSPLAPLKYYDYEPGVWTLHSENRACLKVKEKPPKFEGEMARVIKESGVIVQDQLGKP